jgi:hypothetical protein
MSTKKHKRHKTMARPKNGGPRIVRLLGERKRSEPARRCLQVFEPCTTIHESFVFLRKLSAGATPGRSAGFQTCCVADFQVGEAFEVVRPAGWKPAIQQTWKSALLWLRHGRAVPFRGHLNGGIWFAKLFGIRRFSAIQSCVAAAAGLASRDTAALWRPCPAALQPTGESKELLCSKIL